jgi:L-fucose dehydrogenase
MDLGLKDKLIVITGGASGIGQAITRGALAEGARVAILTRLTPAAIEFRDEIAATGAAAEIVELELIDTAACTQAIRDIESRHGDTFALINNAAINDGVSLATGTVEAFEQSLRLNLVHAFVLAQAALPALKRTQGTILNIASKVALTGQGNTSGYAAAKGGILGLTREWAVDLLPFGIRVNAIVPAEVMTPAYQTWLDTLADAATTLEAIERKVPLGHRMTTPAEIAATALFLLSPTQSSHTTGQLLHVDGGYVHLDRKLT